jgi:hypothetical protein
VTYVFGFFFRNGVTYVFGDICLTYPVPCSPDGQVTEEEQRGESVLGGEDSEKEYEQVRKYLLTNYFCQIMQSAGFSFGLGTACSVKS